MSETIKISKIDETSLKVHCSFSVMQEISEQFTFPANNSAYSPAFQSGKWDGNIRLFNRRAQTLPLGLLDILVAWAEHNKINVEIENDFQYENEFSAKEAVEFFDSLDIPKKYTKRDYQMMGFLHGFRKKRCILLSPTNSGKSIIMFLLICKILTSGKSKGVVIVPTVQLVEQLYNDFMSYGLDVENLCHRVHAGTGMGINTDKPITITTWQSLAKQPKHFHEQFEFLIGDEAHHFKAKELKKIMDSMHNAEYRIGLTGSLDGSVVHKLALTGMFGKIKTLAKSHELIKRGLSSQTTVKALVLKHPKQICTLRTTEKWGYQQELSYLCQCDYRNKYITNLALSLEGNSLILFNYVEKHGKLLKKMIDKHNKEGKHVFYISGETKVEERLKITEFVKKNNNCIVIASYGTFSTGIDLPTLVNCILAIGYKSRIRNLQSIGRMLRKFEDTTATIFDIGDDLMSSTSGFTNHSYLHFRERLKLWVAERYNLKTYKINIGV